MCNYRVRDTTDAMIYLKIFLFFLVRYTGRDKCPNSNANQNNHTNQWKMNEMRMENEFSGPRMNKKKKDQ